MKYTYTGPEIAVEVFGLIFPRDTAVDVTDAHAAAKLKTHPEFEGGDGDDGKARQHHDKKGHR